MAPTHIIACSVFKDALAYLTQEWDRHTLTFTFLPSYLHLRPNELRQQLLTTIQTARETQPFAGCLYGQCFAGIDAHLDAEKVVRIPCDHCFEIFLGRRRYQRLLSETPGTFFVEKELLLDFDDLCRAPLELDDPEMLEFYFKHYQQVVYIRQPRDPDLAREAAAVADLLGLKLVVEDADYTELKDFLVQRIG